MNIIALAIIVLVYLAVIVLLGYKGFRDTKDKSDYMVGGRSVHPYAMALSYGATFISTSAIIGFGGVAGLYGMSLLWLTFLNILVGIFIAFVFIGKRTRKMGYVLQAHTFSELLGKRYSSRFLQGFSGLLVFLFMPLYTAAVLIGAASLMSVLLNIDFNIALLLFALIVCAYVFFGGMKGAVYTDAAQGVIMFVGMLILVIFTYVSLGGITSAHERLSKLDERLEGDYQALVMKIGSRKAKRLDELISAGDDAALQSYIREEGMSLPELEKYKKANANRTFVNNELKSIGSRGWGSMPRLPKIGAEEGESRSGTLWMIIITSITLGVGIGVIAQPQLVVRLMTVRSDRELNRAVLIGGVFILVVSGGALAVGALSNVFFYENSGSISAIFSQGADNIIPEFIDRALPQWFEYIFFLTILAAGMSTLSSQFHVMGTSIGHDVFESWILRGRKNESTILVTRIGVVVAGSLAIALAYILPGLNLDGVIARATAIFFGLSAASFLPAYIGGLYWRGATRAGAISSVISGFVLSAVWLTFFQAKEAAAVKICRALFGKPTLAGGLWQVTDAVVIALPISAIVFVVVSLLTRKTDNENIEKVFDRTK